ncbi:MAG TPA: PRC-barrel domain-containing protein [Hyphomicrobiaceae bacterium]|nr:PRC-barrel domain-containing protein [Hyphomicrobiaceae bacterium]
MDRSSRVYLSIAMAALTIGCIMAGASFAQPDTATDPAAPVAAGLAPRPEEAAAAPWVSKSRDLESVLGREVHTSIEEGGGRIVDLLADRDGRIEAAVIEFGGFLGIGTRKIAVEWSALSFTGEGKNAKVMLDMTRNQLRRAPEYKPGEPAIVRKADR